ncbi:hypothetical protein MTO96_023626 [Rhipicephalus appendiculatus]
MEAPLMGVHLLKAVPEDYLAEVDRIYSRLKRLYERQLRTSSWLDSLSLKYALEKLRAMRLANGFPHDLRNARDMDARFVEFPESPRGGSFWRAWLSAARIVSRLGVTSNSSSDIVFTTGNGVAFYGTVLDEVFVPAGMIGRPVFYKQGPAAHNYGVIGMIIAHEMTHGYDTQGVNVDAGGLWHQWLTQWSRLKYSSVIQCIQQSHAKVGKMDVNLTRHASENLADFVGALVSHAAFSSLPRTPAPCHIARWLRAQPDQRAAVLLVPLCHMVHAHRIPAERQQRGRLRLRPGEVQRAGHEHAQLRRSLQLPAGLPG